MSRRIEPKEEMTARILSATEALIVKEGLQNLSMRNIAVQAGIASGTLYLYFKTKEDLLRCLATCLFERYESHMSGTFDPDADLFTQYGELFRKKWAFLAENLPLIKQFQAVLGIDELIRETIDAQDSFWNRLISEGKKRKLLADLPDEILYALSVGTLIDIKYLQRFSPETDFERYLDAIILRTWKAIAF